MQSILPSEINSRPVAFWIKCALLVVFLLLSTHELGQRLLSIGLQFGLLVFIVLWLITFLSLLIIAMTPNHVLKIAVVAIIIMLTIIGKSYTLIVNNYLGFSDYESIASLHGYLSDLLAHYDSQILHAISISCLGLIAFLMPPFTQHWPRRIHGIHILPIIATTLILYSRGGYGTNGLPEYSNIIAYAFIEKIDALMSDTDIKRNPITIRPSADPEIEHIVLLIDESVRGDYLSLNNNNGIDIGLPDHKLVNFGIATSVSNCSHSSNVSVRFGATRNNPLFDIKINPSIWSYAGQAGYKSIFIDGQRTGGDLMNDMTETERDEIDEFIQLPVDIEPHVRDIAIASIIRDQLRSREKTLIYVNKMGVHFPYESKYPIDRKIYSPTMEKSYFGFKIDPPASEARKPELSKPETRMQSINSYKNAIAWNTGYFFDVLLRDLDLDKTLIIYTSDHGQDFHEDGRPGWITHCRVEDASWNEGIVPFVMITENKPLLEKLNQAAKQNYNNVSLFNLYPTLLNILGYSPQDIRTSGHSELSIFHQLPADNRSFISYFYTRFGRNPTYNNQKQE